MNTVVTIATPSSLQVKSGNSNCTVENLKESANKGNNIRLSTMIDEAYNKTIQALQGQCHGPLRDEFRWLQQILVLEECSRYDSKKNFTTSFGF